MKTLLLLLFICFSTLYFTQDRPDSCDDKKKSGYVVYYGKDRPDSGIPDSGKVEEGNYVNDRKEGQWIRYHRDGKTPKLIGTYQNNRPVGGYQKFYTTGTIREKGAFFKNYYHDTLLRYYENGVEEYRAFYNENGKEEGVVRYSFDNGQTEYTYTAKNGVPTDSVYWYNREGVLIRQGVSRMRTANCYAYTDIEYIYQADSQTILAAGRTTSGNDSIEKAPPVNATCPFPPKFNPDGTNKIYNDDREIWQDGVFKDGCLWDGKVYVYDTDGILIKVKIFRNGLYHSDGQL